LGALDLKLREQMQLELKKLQQSLGMRMVRTHLSDVIGKRADLRISDRVFGHALRLKNNVRSKSTGSFISQIRELESVRELITSTTIGA
ncbi:hypothetical protein O5537_28580, partial [Escherichia coli]|nr:hypothetical protein [Escherichia coli]